MESNDRYLPPVNGHPGLIEAEKVREDPAILVAAIASAVEYVEKQDPQNWLDCFALNNKVYDVNICPNVGRSTAAVSWPGSTPTMSSSHKYKR